jgi:lysozyme
MSSVLRFSLTTLFAGALCLAALPSCTATSSGTPGSEDESGQSDDEALKVCAAGTTVKGADVSYYQGTINWDQYKSSGHGFAITRLSDGTGYHDPKFATNWAGMKKVGLVRGVYQFFRPSEDAIAQADLLLSKVGKLEKGDLPPVLDVEVMDGVSSAHLVSGVKKWVSHVQAATGMRPIIYTSPGFLNGVAGASELGKVATLWVANWGVSCPGMPSGFSTWKFWQNSDSGHASGISGAIDTDVFNGSMKDLLAFAHQ